MTPDRALRHPATLIGLALLLPVLGASRLRPDIVLLVLAWLAFCRIWTERWFGAGRPDLDEPEPASRLRTLHVHLAGWLAMLAGAVAVGFIRAWGMWLPLLFLVGPVLIADATSGKLEFRFHRHFARLPLLSVLLCALITFGGYGGWVERGAPAMNDDFLYPLRANPSPAPLSAADQQSSVAMVRGALSGSPAAPTGALTMRHNQRTWVTLFRSAKKKRWVRGHAEAGVLGEQLVTATAAAKREARDAGWSTDFSQVRIQIDREGPSQTMRARWFRALVARIGVAIAGDGFAWRFEQYDDEAGVDGFRLTDGDRDATVLPADPLLDGWFSPRNLKARFRVHNWQRTLSALVSRGGFARGEPWPSGATLSNFRTDSFAQPDPSSPRTVQLFRGNTLFEGELDEDRLLIGIAEAGEWLLGTVQADGKFDYEYFPTRDDHGRGYNEVRHAGSVYGLFHVAHMGAVEPSLAGRRGAYIDAGVRALDRVYSMLGTPPGASDDFVAFIETRRKGPRVDTGAQALTLLSFLERPKAESVADPALAARLWRQGDDALMAGLARTLIALVDDRGWVHRRWSEARAGKVMERQPLYYPGELMLALALYHRATGDADALDAAKRVGRAQITYHYRPWEIPDHWVMQALDVLDELDPDTTAWRDAAYEMGREYVSEQFPPQVPHAPDYRGAYRRDLEIARTTRAASRGEAIGGVARIAWRRGDPAEVWERSLIEGARHLLEQQYSPDNSFTFPEPTEGLGAIRMGLIDNHCRIDNNQHGVVALDAALHAMRRREAR